MNDAISANLIFARARLQARSEELHRRRSIPNAHPVWVGIAADAVLQGLDDLWEAQEDAKCARRHFA